MMPMVELGTGKNVIQEPRPDIKIDVLEHAMHAIESRNGGKDIGTGAQGH